MRSGRSGLAFISHATWEQLTNKVSTECNHIIGILCPLKRRVCLVSTSHHKFDTRFSDNVTYRVERVCWFARLFSGIRCARDSSLNSVDICQLGLVFDERARKWLEYGKGIILTHVLEFGEGRDSDTDSVGTNGIGDGIEHSERESESVLE